MAEEMKKATEKGVMENNNQATQEQQVDAAQKEEKKGFFKSVKEKAVGLWNKQFTIGGVVKAAAAGAAVAGAFVAGKVLSAKVNATADPGADPMTEGDPDSTNSEF